MELCNTPYIYLLLILLTCWISCEDLSCGPGLDTGGVTVPKGDIRIKYGNPLEIYCLLNPKGSLYPQYTSKSLVFKHGNEIISGEKFVEVINDTAIKLVIKHPPPSVSSYTCQYRNNSIDNTTAVSYKGICFNKVFVGMSPQEVHNFSCVSHNWQNLECTWTPPENYVQTNYTLRYLPSRSSRWFHCPQKEQNNFCYWNLGTSPIYRNTVPNFTFNLTAKNEFGVRNFTYHWNHFANVIPDKPVNLSSVDATFNSLTIQWDLPYELLHFPPKVVHKVEYQSNWESVWVSVDESEIIPFQREEKEIKTQSYKLNITNLKYAYTLYDIRVFMRANVTELPFKWSQPATTTLRTKPTVPGMSPKTVLGSYKSVQSTQQYGKRDIYIYWQQIPKYMENGDDFEYKVISVKENGHERKMKPFNITKTYAKFEGSPLNNYTFKIVSSNKEGDSEPPSEIFVPSSSESPQGPLMVTKIADYSEYRLVWKATNSSNIQNYTVFWCNNKKDSPYECIGYLNWTYVSKDTESFNISMPKEDGLYEFAVSANTLKTSSGMQWASCVLSAKEIMDGGPIKTAWIENLGKRSFVVKWKLECLNQGGVVKDFSINYCPIEKPEIPACRGPMEEHVVKSNPGENLIEQATLENLQPYTTYAVSVNIKGTIRASSEKAAMQVTTLEAAPDVPPRSVEVVNVTNSSVTLTWLPPEPRNGKILDYKVHWGNGSISNIKNSDEDTTLVTLSGLESYIEYNVSMSACTKECSSALSPPLYFKTKIGAPGKMEPPLVDVLKEVREKINITWTPPPKPSGPIDHYVIEFQRIEDRIYTEEFKSQDLFVEKETGCTSSSSNTAFKARVRAVNVDSLNRSYSGPWSPFGSANCIPSSLGLNAIVFLIIIGIILLILMCLTIGALIRWVWLRCKAMQNVEIKLPPNLTPGSDKEKDGDLHFSMHVWNPPIQDCAAKDSPCPDQQLLLNKEKDDILDSSVDEEELGENRESSGCGSGHGSVSSSNNGAAHISSDSGTEVDQRASSPEVFSESPNQRDLLRQQVVSSNGSGDGYYRVTPGPVTGGLGYVSMPTSNASRGYVMHPPMWVTSDPPPKGYVVAAPPLTHAVAPSTYCQVGWKPSETHKSNHDWGVSASAMNRVTDSEGDTQPSSL